MYATNCATVLRDKLGDDGFDALDDMITLRQEKLLTIDRFESGMTALRAELRGEMQQLRADLRVDIAECRAELMKWAMVFWIAQAAAVAGIVAAIR